MSVHSRLVTISAHGELVEPPIPPVFLAPYFHPGYNSGKDGGLTGLK